MKILFVICLLILVCVHADKAHGRCPVGWQPFQNSCYLLNQNTVTWKEASDACYARGGHLASLETEKEHSFLKLQVKFTGGDLRYWVDGTDEEKEGVWKWASSQEVNTLTDWYPGEPNAGTKENCMLLYKSKVQLANYICATKSKYICEKEQQKFQSETSSCNDYLLKELVKCRKSKQ